MLRAVIAFCSVILNEFEYGYTLDQRRLDLVFSGRASESLQRLDKNKAKSSNFKMNLEVNCMFKGPRDFEYTQELTVFDGLSISLYHGLHGFSNQQSLHWSLRKESNRRTSTLWS